MSNLPGVLDSHRLHREANVSRVMHFFNASCTGYINRKHQGSGHLLQGRYPFRGFPQGWFRRSPSSE